MPEAAAAPGRLPACVFTESLVHMDEFTANERRGRQRRYVRNDWRYPFAGGNGFRHDYDPTTAAGGWEFHRLQPGLCLAMMDMVPHRLIPARHCLPDQLVVSIMLDGVMPLRDGSGQDADMLGGRCAVYGLSAEAELYSLYPQGAALKWIDVYIDRHRFSRVSGLEVGEMPASVRQFLRHGGSLPCRQLAMPGNVPLVLSQIATCSYGDGLRRTFLTAKALEITCSVLHALADHGHDAASARNPLSPRDYPRLERVERLMREHLDQPLDIAALASRCGLSREKLQWGFRMLHGGTVASVQHRWRMQQALQRLHDSSASILEIALDAGYQQASSFARAFRGMYGVSPTQARAQPRPVG